MANIRITLFDDNERIRESLGLLFEQAEGFEMAGSFPDCTDILERIELNEPSVVLMDIDMPGINGIEAVGIIRNKYPDLQILMLTVFDDDEKVFDAICAGANGYLLKNKSLERLVEHIKEVSAGGAPMSPSIARRVLQLFHQHHAPNKENFNLSSREKEVLSFLVKGASYKMIADHLKIGYDTVHSHIKNIYKKLQVNSMTEAVAKAIKNRITNAH